MNPGIFSTTIRPLLASLIVFTVLFGGVYPAATTLISQLLFPRQAEGSLITIGGKQLGSELIGQNFTAPNYFWGRISATTPPYNAASSSGSNYGSANPALLAAVKKRLADLKAADPSSKAAVPVDLVTASASGLDPHISPAAAEYQVARVAIARKMPREAVATLVKKYTEGRQFFVLGEPRVNVLKLNMALDGTIKE